MFRLIVKGSAFFLPEIISVTVKSKGNCLTTPSRLSSRYNLNSCKIVIFGNFDLPDLADLPH